jgi:chromosomal replication initiator protein
MPSIAEAKMAAPLGLQNDQTQLDFANKFSAICLEHFGAEIFDKWLANLELSAFLESEVIFSASSKFLRDWIVREFVEVKKGQTSLLSLAQQLAPKLKKLSVICITKAVDEISFQPSSSAEKVVNLSKYDNVFTFGTELNPRFKFENFVNLKSNKLAAAMAKIAAGIDAQINLFDDKIPLFIHGGVGMGKTHLAQAVAWQIKENDRSKKVVYLSAEKFMYHFVQSIRGNDVMSFKEKMRSIDVLIVDDVQFIAGKENTQQEFMNCFNYLVENNKQVILVCDRCPTDLEKIDEKLKSRISGGMVVNFKNPDYSDRLTFLKARTQLFGHEICEKVLSLIAEKISASVRDLEGALKKLIAEKVLDEKEITLESAKAILGSYLRNSATTAISIEKIQKAVAQFYEIKIADLKSKNRTKAVARARQIAMYLAKTMTSLSLPKIGDEFGGKNHATVIHSVKLVQELLNSDRQVFEEVKSLEERIR